MQQELLICVLNRPELLDDVLAALLEIGVTGSTVIDTKGMGKVISQDIPIFAGFKSMFSGARESNVTIFSVMDKDLVEEAISTIEESYASFEDEATGIVFTLPVSRVRGLSKNLD